MNTKPILYVEDDPNDAYFMSLGLRKTGIRVPLQVVVNGQEAVDYLEGNLRFADRERYPLPCMVILDLKLPLLDGLDVLRWIREQPSFESLPVVIFSSSAHEADKHEARHLGALDYILKPSDMLLLGDILRNLVKLIADDPVHPHPRRAG